ncbi:MAG: hypothetical protein KBC90_16135, partial [Spirochaetes bacterium]|nr:hypothetical protein [Spirochaetota bacterium]
MVRRIVNKIASEAKKRDYLARSICLLLAVILWAYIAAGKTDTLRFRMPIVPRNVPSQLAVSDMSDRYAVLVVEGRKEHLKSINMKNIRAYVNLDNAVIGSKEYPIRLEKQQVPEEVTLSLASREVTVTTEKKTERWVRVVPVIEGSVRKGKIMIDRMVFPERVRITGPKSIIDSIDSLDTEEVSVDNEAADLHRQVGLRHERLADISLSEKVFTVKVTITDLKDLVMVTLPVSILNGSKDFDYELRDREAEVYIRAKNNLVVAADQVEASVDA